jgi:hypothetical protein
MRLPPLIELLAAWLGVVGLIWTIFDRTEQILTDTARRSLTDWLKNVKPKEENQVWIRIFTGILNKVFGTEYLSWKTFSRSCIASIIAMVLMALIYFLNVKPPFVNLLSTPNLILTWGLITFFVDYASLCESRGVITEMGKSGTGGVILFLIGDFILTISIFVTGGGLVLMTAQGTGQAQEIASIKAILTDPNIKFDSNDPNAKFDPNDPNTISRFASILALSKGIANTVDLTLKGLPFWYEKSTAPLFGIFFCSTFVTSVWVWLYMLGGLVIKAIQYLGLGTGKLRRWLDIEKQPMLAIGYVCMMLITLGFILILIF